MFDLDDLIESLEKKRNFPPLSFTICRAWVLMMTSVDTEVFAQRKKKKSFSLEFVIECREGLSIFCASRVWEINSSSNVKPSRRPLCEDDGEKELENLIFRHVIMMVIQRQLNRLTKIFIAFVCGQFRIKFQPICRHVPGINFRRTCSRARTYQVFYQRSRFSFRSSWHSSSSIGRLPLVRRMKHK